ncbi:MAG: type II secretion system protein [bacterium]|nr:type II secretion system protein [bacterium]
MNKGFSIIEAIVTCVILGVIVLAVIRLFPTSAVVNARADRMSEATVVAEDKIEQFRSMGFDELKNLIITGYNTGTDTIGYITRSWALTDSIENVVRVDVTCSWRVPGSTGYSSTRVITQISKHD